MKIQSVAVEVHEKRAHPSRMGHYDASVRLSAELDDGDDATVAVLQLQHQARQHVATECDRWEAQVNREKQREDARSNLDWVISLATHNSHTDANQEKFEQALFVLPADERPDFVQRLEKARAEYVADAKRQLEELFASVERRGATHHDDRRFDLLLQSLPEAEREVHGQRWEEANKPKIVAGPPPAARDESIPF